MSLRYKRQLLSHLAHDAYQPATFETIAEDLGFEDLAEARQAVEEMAGAGDLEIGPQGKLRLISVWDLAQRNNGCVEGKFSRARKGFGFLKTDHPVREGDLYIPARATRDAMTGDVVRVEVKQDKRGGGRGVAGSSGYVGEVVEIIERKQAAFTGTVERRGKDWIVEPDGKTITDPIIVRDAESKNVKPGDKVVVEITEYPEDDYLAEGVIVRVLGDAGRPDVETEAVIAAHDLPSNEFPEDCVQQARDVTAQFHEAIERYQAEGSLEGRRDQTGDYVITIDPPDAKDYDDAISIRKLDNGWELHVHIADVAYFIERDSPLDVEAADRANSCYLPRLVIPMLPEILSNGICSLQEGVERFVKTAMIRYDTRGNVTAQGASSGLIKSAKRLTYLEAQALIDGDREEARKHARTDTPYTDQLVSTLKEMNACSKSIQARRKKLGMISLDLPEVELIYDDDGHVIDAEPEDDAFTHTLIEMFMVEANEVLARLFEDLDVPLIRRIHPDPNPNDVEHLQRVATVAGYRVPERPTREEIQGLIEATRGKPPARAVHMAVLRTLTKAEYSPALIGHFALASEAYAHFTSPIRRYADLTVHRALGEYLRQTGNAEHRPKSESDKRKLGKRLLATDACPSEQELMAVARHCTVREQNAEDAERELRQFLVLQLLEKHIGETFSGLVTGVAQRGIFIQLDKYLADGMVAKEDLPGDVTRDNRRPIWQIDKRTGGLVDQNSGRSYNMGDTVEVAIAKIDLARRQMDLTLVSAESRAAGKARKTPELTLGGVGGGLDRVDDFKGKTGAQRRSQKSKSRDRGKKDYRDDRKNKRR